MTSITGGHWDQDNGPKWVKIRRKSATTFTFFIGFIFCQISFLEEIFVFWLITTIFSILSFCTFFLQKVQYVYRTPVKSGVTTSIGHPCRKVTFTHNWHADMMIIIMAERGHCWAGRDRGDTLFSFFDVSK